MNDDDPIIQAWRDATNCYLAGMGLPPLSAATRNIAPAERSIGAEDAAPFADPDNEPVQRGSPLWNRLRKPDVHDFRDYPSRDRPDWDMDARGNPLKPGT